MLLLPIAAYQEAHFLHCFNFENVKDFFPKFDKQLTAYQASKTKIKR